MRIDLDTPVSCADGACGVVADVIIDPVSRRLTHFVLEPKDDRSGARLIPVDASCAAAGTEGVALDWTIADVGRCKPIHEAAYLRMGEVVSSGPDWSVGIQEMFSLPEYGNLGPEALGVGMALEHDQHVAVSYHRVPPDEIEIRRASPVTSSDGHHLGHVVGFVIDAQQRITELILGHGHLWTKRRVAIPASAIERCENDELTLSLTADEVGELKPLPAHRQSS